MNYFLESTVNARAEIRHAVAEELRGKVNQYVTDHEGISLEAIQKIIDSVDPYTQETPQQVITCDNCNGFLARSNSGYYCTTDRDEAMKFYSFSRVEDMCNEMEAAGWLYYLYGKAPCDCAFYTSYGSRVHMDDCQSKQALKLCTSCKATRRKRVYGKYVD